MPLKTDASLCEGHGQLVAVDPDSFELDGNLTVRHRELPTGAVPALLREAVMACPTEALKIADR
jgi:ferredoxin